VGVWTLRPGPEPALPAADPAPVTAAQPAPESAGAVVEIATSPAPDTATPTASSPSPSAAPARATATQRPGGADTPPEAATDAAQDTALASLQRESAQLEGLLALARDDSVGSAGAVLLADAFDARLAGIDALLANSALADEEREALWHARVDTLRQAAGFTSTQRLLAAQGQGDAWLASVD